MKSPEVFMWFIDGGNPLLPVYTAGLESNVTHISYGRISEELTNSIFVKDFYSQFYMKINLL